MSTAARLAGFGAVVVVALVLGWFVGGAVGPVGDVSTTDEHHEAPVGSSDPSHGPDHEEEGG